MVRRSQRGCIKTTAVMEKLAEGRQGAIEVCRTAKINGPEYIAAGLAMKSIDDLAEVLTGDKQALWLGNHSTP